MEARVQFTFSNQVLIEAACMVSRCEALKTKRETVAYNPSAYSMPWCTQLFVTPSK